MNSFSNLKVCVTGGAGFIGSHLVEKLLARGAEVTVIDNFTHGNKLEELGAPDHLTVCQGDVRDLNALSKCIKGKDIVFHLAALVGVEETQQVPLEVLDVDVQGTVNVLKLAADCGVRRVIHASSSEVYGDSSLVMDEDTTLSPKSTYAISKLVGEEYCRAFFRKYNLEYTCLRYFNVYGPRQDERLVITRFIKKSLSDEPLLILGDGEQTRDFTYVDDAVSMTLLAGIKPETKCEAINIGTGLAVTINELARLILKMLDKKTAIKYVEYSGNRPREVEVFTRCASTVKAGRLLDYKPETDLATGIRKTIEWYLKKRGDRL